MHEARVLVVDDSAAMRALFSDILDEAKNVRVVGVAANAGAARDQIAELKPNVITLDVEMPGMSGIEFLAEIMETNPLPVVMLSSMTQMGTGTAVGWAPGWVSRATSSCARSHRCRMCSNSPRSTPYGCARPHFSERSPFILSII